MGARKLAEAVEGLAMEMKSPAEWQGRRQRGEDSIIVAYRRALCGGKRFGHAQVNWSHGRVSNSEVKASKEGMAWKQENWTKHRDKEKWESHNSYRQGKKKEMSSEVGEKWTEAELSNEQKERFGVGVGWGCKPWGSLQSKQRPTEGWLSGSGWARGGDTNTRM